MFLPEGPLKFDDLRDQVVLIAGLGREGQAVAERLLAEGAPKLVLGLSEQPDTAAEEFNARFPTIPTFYPGADIFFPPQCEEANVAIMSPGIPRSGRFYSEILERNIIRTSGSAMFVADHGQSVIGVTGSKGKSTTTSLLHSLLSASGVSVEQGGNMGTPVQSLGDAEFFAIEFSSFQCHYLKSSPALVGLTSLFPEHLDWHGSTESYYADKLRIVSHNPESVVANGDDPVLVDLLDKYLPKIDVLWVGEGREWHLESDGSESWLCRRSEKVFYSGDGKIRGKHNQQNMLVALALADSTGRLEMDVVSSVLKSFEGLPHRLESIAEPGGPIFVNDSLATNPQAAAAALRTVWSKKMVWIVGGEDRGVDYQPLVDQAVNRPPRTIIGLPSSGEKILSLIGKALESRDLSEAVTLEQADSMRSAVKRARELSGPGEYVLLSPAAPSFGEYRDYRERAEAFRQSIAETRRGGRAHEPSKRKS